jgi:hypothetical protein
MRTKKKIKWKRIMLWSLAVVLGLGISGLFAMNYVVNKVIESMAVSLETEKVQETKIDPKTVSPNDTLPAAPSQTMDNAAQDTTSETKQDKLTTKTAKHSTEKTIPKQTTTPKPTSEVKYDDPKKEKVGVYAPEISTDKANAIKENVTLSEKASVTSILLGNVSLSDIKLFQELASGGMTTDEKRAARKVLLDKLTPEEYNTLSQIAKKYGVSEGKTYDQAKKEEATTP